MSEITAVSEITAMADELLDGLLSANPVGATLIGLPGYDDQLTDYSPEGEARRRAAMADLRRRAEAVDPSTLDARDRVTRAVIVQQAQVLQDKIDAATVEYAITDLYITPATALITFLPMLVVPDADKAENVLARLRAVPDHLDTVAQRHRAGIAAGRTPVRRLVQAALDRIDAYLADQAADPIAAAAVPQGYAERRDQLVTDAVRPAIARYRDMLRDEVLPTGRPDDRPGVCWLPDGEAHYATLAGVFTSTDRTPEQLHQTGLDLMAALREEYAELGLRLFGTAEQGEIFHRMQTDPAMRWRDGDELLAHAHATVERAQAAAPDWFGRLPTGRCAIESTSHGPAAYYMPPAVDGSRPGTYFANTDRAHERDRFVSEVMAFHEAVPGHHFQMALAVEQDDLPMARRFADATAFIEGWGLYTERLADEMGLYSDDLARLGMLAMDSMRAGRLVVDTGIHAKGWSRAQAIDYLRTNTPLSLLEITNEVDRYTAYTGQALSYMVGRLEIQRLRSLAEQHLGERFDLRAFHDLVLGNGPLPLTVLDEVVTDWIGAASSTP